MQYLKNTDRKRNIYGDNFEHGPEVIDRTIKEIYMKAFTQGAVTDARLYHRQKTANNTWKSFELEDGQN